MVGTRNSSVEVHIDDTIKNWVSGHVTQVSNGLNVKFDIVTSGLNDVMTQFHFLVADVNILKGNEGTSRFSRLGKLEFSKFYGDDVQGWGAPEISHLFFADDSILFTRVSLEECNKLKGMLERYCKASGQVINYEKSEISFSTNVDLPTRTRIIESLEIKKKLGRWKEKTLSSERKEVLIKSVAQAIPMYVMNIFLLPETLINDIHKALKLYWWGNGVKQNPIRWCSWEKMCMADDYIANTLVARVLKARYFPISTSFEANVGYHPSYIWRSFHRVKELVRKGCKWNICDGRNVNVWEDYWLEDHRRLGPKPDNCKTRGLTLTSLTCTHCGEIGEDVMHILYKCSMAKEVWIRSGFGYLYEGNDPDTLDDFCCMILKNSSLSWETFIMIPWGLWARRNKNFHGQHDGRDQEVDAAVKHILAKIPSGEPKRQVKINYDASWSKEFGNVGLGFVARNHNGEVLLSGAQGECFASSPLEVEAKAILWDMNHARSRSYMNVVFESDYLCLVNALRSRSTLLQIANMFSRILSISLAFSSCQWSFVKREGNKFAHGIDAWVVGCNNEIVLEGRVSDCALKCVMEDILLYMKVYDISGTTISVALFTDVVNSKYFSSPP
ncbi:reverse transcriptase [Tanacetum coccineum]